MCIFLAEAVLDQHGSRSRLWLRVQVRAPRSRPRSRSRSRRGMLKTALQGYMPGQLFNLNSSYGSKDDLLKLLQALKYHGVKSVCDIVINHRSAHSLNIQTASGKQARHEGWGGREGEESWHGAGLIKCRALTTAHRAHAARAGAQTSRAQTGYGIAITTTLTTAASESTGAHGPSQGTADDMHTPLAATTNMHRLLLMLHPMLDAHPTSPHPS